MCGAVAGGLPGRGRRRQGSRSSRASCAAAVSRWSAYVRLLDGTGEFTAEVPTSATGEFRFFAAPGTWTVRALVPGGTADRTVNASVGEISEVEVAV